MARILSSDLLRETLNAVERFEASERAMRSEWPAPTDGTIREWNKARTGAEVATARVKKALGS